MPKYIWLSFPLGLDDPRPPAIPAPKLATLYTVEKDAASVHILEVASHIGTHVDSQCHVVEGGVRITDYSPQEFIFVRPVVVDLRIGDAEIVTPEDILPWQDALATADMALFRFGYGEVRRTDPARFSLRSPGFGIESSRWLRKNFQNLRAIGMDVPSLACIASLDETMSAHNELLSGNGRRFLVMEDVNLEHDLSGLTEVRLSPWLVSGMDSGPCSIVGILSQ